jgi:hypothetical protein
MSRILSLAAVLCLGPSTLSAQVEFGVDGGLEVESFAEGADNLTVVSFPSNLFRFGFWTSPTVGMELRTSVFRQSQGDASATSAWKPGTGDISRVTTSSRRIRSRR